MDEGKKEGMEMKRRRELEGKRRMQRKRRI